MPFGKHKGLPVAELPDDYLRWLWEDVELRDPLRSAVFNVYHARFVQGPSSTPPRHAVQAMANAIVTTGYRKLALDHHPDHGGDTGKMQTLNAARDLLRNRLEHAA